MPAPPVTWTAATSPEQDGVSDERNGYERWPVGPVPMADVGPFTVFDPLERETDSTG
jgi:hypothetical protein